MFFTQTLAAPGAEKIAQAIAASVADGEKGVPVYWGHPDVPELAHKYPDKRAKGWIKSATVEGDALVLSVEWLEENATDGFGWFSPYWGGPATDLGQGRYLKTIERLTSVALINIPNIQEFRLANERTEMKEPYKLPENIVKLANEFDESKHPRANDGKFSSTGGGYARKDNEVASRLLGGALKNYKGDRTSQAEWINQRLHANRAGKKDADTARAGKELHHQRIRGAHIAAILSGLKYNRTTHQYE